MYNISQYVKIKQSKSKTKNITCGVPRGSVLGPLLFIIYTNDIETFYSVHMPYSLLMIQFCTVIYIISITKSTITSTYLMIGL